MKNVQPLAIVPQHFGCLVFDHRTSRYMPFDHECSELFEKLIEHSVWELVEHRVGEERQALIDFHNHFEQLGYFRVDGRLAASRLAATPPEDHLLGPLALHLEIIGACNLTCKHCFAGELPRNHSPLSLSEITRLFDELANLGTYRIGLTGGEPLMRRDLFAIIDAATQRGLHPCLTTNGLLLTEELAKQFAQRELVWLNVSLDGATPVTNDAVRGEGTYAQVIEKVRLLARHSRFTLAFTLTSHNAHEVEQCAELAQQLGAHTAVFRPMYPVGTGLQHLELMPSYEQYATALMKLGNLETEDLMLHSIDPFSPIARQATQARISTNAGCGAANTIATVSVQGDVNPCSFLGPAYNAGNLRESSFAEIWHASQGFQSMRKMSSGCGSCENEFEGGCRARALVYSGDVNAQDPWFAEYQSHQRLWQITL